MKGFLIHLQSSDQKACKNIINRASHCGQGALVHLSSMHGITSLAELTAWSQVCLLPSCQSVRLCIFKLHHINISALLA